MHRLGSCWDYGIELFLQVRIGHRGKGSLSIVLVKFRESTEHRLAEVNIGAWKGWPQIGADLLGRLGNVPGVFDEGTQSLIDWSIGAAHIEVGIQGLGIEQGVLVGCLSRLQPEQVRVDYREQVLLLETFRCNYSHP